MAMPLRYKSLQRSGITGRKSFNSRDLPSLELPGLPPPQTNIPQETDVTAPYNKLVHDYDVGGGDTNPDEVDLPMPDKDLAESWGEIGRMHLPALGMMGLGFMAGGPIGMAAGAKGYVTGKGIQYLGRKTKEYIIDPAMEALGIGGDSDKPSSGPGYSAQQDLDEMTSGLNSNGLSFTDTPQHSTQQELDALTQLSNSYGEWGSNSPGGLGGSGGWASGMSPDAVDLESSGFDVSDLDGWGDGEDGPGDDGGSDVGTGDSPGGGTDDAESDDW